MSRSWVAKPVEKMIPEVGGKTAVLLKHERRSPAGRRKGLVAGILCFKLRKASSNFTAPRIFKSLGTTVAKASRFASMGKTSGKVSSATCLVRSRSLSDSIESHRAEAIEDCIEFLHLHRSNSVSA